MATRITPQEYFKAKKNQEQVRTIQPIIQNGQIYVPITPNWVPVIVGIALVGAFVVAMYAISKVD